MKKSAKVSTVKKVNKKVVLTKKASCLFEINQLPIIISLVAVILAAILVMTKMYLPKQGAEVYVLSGTQVETSENQ